MKEITIIGYGNFGKLIVQKLKKFFKVFVYDPKLKDMPIVKGIYYSTIPEALSKKIIILSIPVQYLENFLINNKKYINRRSTVIDVSSVKIKPVELMKKNLPQTVQIIGTHPLFGPNSIIENQKNLKIVVTPVRVNNFKKFVSFLEDELHLTVIEKTAEEHDKEMAAVQGLTHLIAKGLNEIGIPDSGMKTLAYHYLYSMKEILKYDSEDLLTTIQQENPFGRGMRDKFIAKLIEINKRY